MNKIKRGLKNFSYLTLGTIIAQGIGFIGFIYLARYLGPDHYGIFVTVGAFMGIFQLVAFPGLKKTVIREGSKDVENADAILNRTVGLQSVFIMIAIMAMLVGSLFTGYEARTKFYIAIFSLSLFSNSFKSYINTIYKFTEKMEYLAIFEVIRMGLFVGFAILFLKMGFGLFTVVILSVLTSFLDMVLRFYRSKGIVKFNVFSKFRWDMDIVKPSVVFSAMNVAGSLHSKADLFMISLLGTAPEVAIYGVAYYLAREAEVLKNLLGDAFFPVAVKTLHEGRVKKKSIVTISIFSIAGMIVLSVIGYFVAEPVVIFLFGEDYAESGRILQVLIFYMVAYFSTLPFTEAVQATGNEIVVLYGKGTMAILNIPLNIILYWNYGLIGIAYSTLIIYTVGSVIINIYSYHILDKQGYFK